jgi:mono/diheme cytochrome c family protein
MTEIPEHLLQRSKARKAALGLGSADDAAAPAATAAPAAASAATPAAPAAKTLAPVPPAKPPAPPAPPAPWVQAAHDRIKVPVFAMVGLVALPLLAIIIATTLDKPTSTELGPLQEGAAVFTKCGGCHGPSGGGVGNFPALNEGKVLETFPEPFEMMKWVYIGSDGWKAEVGDTVGAQNRAIGTVAMPPWNTLKPEEFATVILHVRHTVSGEEFEPEAWTAAAEKLVADDTFDPAFAEEVATIIEGWAAAPPTEGGGGGGGH